MKLRRAFAVLVLLGFAAGPDRVRAEEPTSTAPSIMPLSEIRPGMKGEAHSVLHGFDLEKYEVEILGVERGGLPDTSMILCRIEGPSLENHGVVAGMSGSPVYIDGRLIGALAYGWGFAYHPYGGITPIEEMLPLLDRLEEDAKTSASSGSSARPTAASSSVAWDWMPEWESYKHLRGGVPAPEPYSFRPDSPEARRVLGDEQLTLVPLASPFFLSGASRRTATRLQEYFSGRGYHLMDAGSSAGSNEDPETPSPPIVGGSAVSMPLMTGSITLAATGTVTYREGNKLLAFGHPAFGSGITNAPMANSYTFGYMQSYGRSFKLSESREIVGAIRQDRQFGIGGLFGEDPPRMDVTVNIKGGAAVAPRTFHYSVWEDRNFLPILTAFVAVPESISAAVSDGAEATARAKMTIRLDDGREITRNIVASSQSGVGMQIAFPLLRDLFLLMSNPFEQADLDSIDIDIEVEPGFRQETLIRARSRYDQVEVGDKVLLDLLWQPYRGEKHTERIEIPIPQDLKPGPYILHLADGNGSQAVDVVHDSGRFAPTNFAETVEVAQSLDYPSDRLRAYLFRPALGVSLRGDAMEGMPGSIQTLVRTSAPPEVLSPVIGEQLAVHEFTYDSPLQARASVAIEVVRYLPQ